MSSNCFLCHMMKLDLFLKHWALSFGSKHATCTCLLYLSCVSTLQLTSSISRLNPVLSWVSEVDLVSIRQCVRRAIVSYGTYSQKRVAREDLNVCQCFWGHIFHFTERMAKQWRERGEVIVCQYFLVLFHLRLWSEASSLLLNARQKRRFPMQHL